MVSDADRRVATWLSRFGMTPADRSRVPAARPVAESPWDALFPVEASQRPLVVSEPSGRLPPAAAGGAFAASALATSKAPGVVEAFEYADSVLAGRVPACHHVRRACQRFLDDAAASDAGAGPRPEWFPWAFAVTRSSRRPPDAT